MDDIDIEQKADREITIIVNARQREVDKDKLTYQEVVNLAFGEVTVDPNVVYTVTYSKGHKPEKGTLVMGGSLTIKQGMIINVTKTDKS